MTPYGWTGKHPPRNSHEWPDHLMGVEQIRDPPPGGNPVCVIWISTERGRKWTCGPHGPGRCAIEEAFRLHDWHDTEEEAIASYEGI